MHFLNSFKLLTSLSLAVSLELTTLAGWVGRTQAQINLDSLDFQPPEGNFATSSNGDPGQSVLGGTRSGRITVLMPISQQGLTLAEHPTLFLYFARDPAQVAYLILEDQVQNIHYEGELPIITDLSGVSRIALPDDAPSLEIDNTYSLSLEIDGTVIDNLIIKRVASTTERAIPLNAIPSLQLAAEYASQGIWFDLVKTLVDLQAQDPDNPEIVQAWEDLLEDEDVELATRVPELLQ